MIGPFDRGARSQSPRRLAVAPWRNHRANRPWRPGATTAPIGRGARAQPPRQSAVAPGRNHRADQPWPPAAVTAPIGCGTRSLVRGVRHAPCALAPGDDQSGTDNQGGAQPGVAVGEVVEDDVTECRGGNELRIPDG